MTVRQECAQLLTYLLYSLACKHLEAQVAAGEEKERSWAFSHAIGRCVGALWGTPLPSKQDKDLPVTGEALCSGGQLKVPPRFAFV